MRATGYYWVKFDWRRFDQPERIHWEPASWDVTTQSWAMLGSRQPVSGARERSVFLEIGDTRILEPQ